MATSGAFGFRINGQDKITYNHYDSWPSDLGKEVGEAIQRVSDEELRAGAERLTLVGRRDKAPAEWAERYKEWAEMPVSVQEGVEWVRLLHKAQGKLEAYVRDLEHMVDDQDFLAKSLRCEWAYIVNLDTERLEVYRGGNEDPRAAGRYADCSPSNQGYVGVRLALELPLDLVRNMEPGKIGEVMELVEGQRNTKLASGDLFVLDNMELRITGGAQEKALMMVQEFFDDNEA